MSNDKLFQDVASANGVSVDAVRSLWDALVRGNGSMAQFSHSELGGYGQWMAGGMTMVGDMFNHSLKAKVDSICGELAGAAREAAQKQSVKRRTSYQSQHQGSGSDSNFAASQSSNRWWPEEFGSPNSLGSQNNLQYAYFSGPKRLVVNRGGKVTVYDTLDHVIGGVSQQQGGSQSLTFSSQRGTVRVADLPIIKDDRNESSTESGSQNKSTAPDSPLKEDPSRDAVRLEPQPKVVPPVREVTTNRMEEPKHSQADPITTLERLGRLRDAGILTEDEFLAKKSELLKRI